MDARTDLYSRQRIASLTGIDDTTLNYWMREGILRAASGGGGEGQHRRFMFPELNLAAIFGELRSFGVALPALRRLSDRFHTALDYYSCLGITFENEETVFDVVLSRKQFLKNGFLEHHVRDGDLAQYSEYAPWVLELERFAIRRQPHSFEVRLSLEQDLDLKKVSHLIYGREREAGEVSSETMIQTALTLDLSEYSENSLYWSLATTYNRREVDGLFSTSASAFCRDSVGDWFLASDITNLPAGVTSFIGVDVEALSFRMWGAE